jgi:hypothetical protein
MSQFVGDTAVDVEIHTVGTAAWLVDHGLWENKNESGASDDRGTWAIEFTAGLVCVVRNFDC